jgi:Tfp pilus assembly PilM family ATPase
MSKSRPILVLQTAEDEIRLVQATLRQGFVELSEACSFWSRNKTGDPHPLQNETTLDALATHVVQHGWVGRDLICLIGGSKVGCYYFDMPPLKGSDLRQAALLKLGQQLHFDPGDAITAVDPLPLRDGGKEARLRVRVTALHRERAAAAMEAAARVGLHLVGLSAMPTAIAALAEDGVKFVRGRGAVLHVDERLTTLVVLDGGLSCVTTELPIGSADLTAALMRPIIAGDNVIQLDEPQAVALRNEVGIPQPDQQIDSLGVAGERLLPLLEPALQKFTKQVTQWLSFAATVTEGKAIELVRVVGPAAKMPGLSQALASRIGREVQPHDWLSGMAGFAGSPQEQMLAESYGPAVGAVRRWKSMPDLIPPEQKRSHRVARVRRAIASCGAVVAAAILAMAVLFERVGRRLDPAINAQTQNLADVKRIAGDNSKWEAEGESIRRMQKEFDDFLTATPMWVGLLKELSILLPSELQATEFVARPSQGGVRMIVTATVFAGEEGRGFDEVVEKTMLILQRSPFCRRVQLLSANRDHKDAGKGAGGTLSVELELACRRGLTKA